MGDVNAWKRWVEEAAKPDRVATLVLPDPIHLGRTQEWHEWKMLVLFDLVWSARAIRTRNLQIRPLMVEQPSQRRRQPDSAGMTSR
jgi:hypothetical protein